MLTPQFLLLLGVASALLAGVGQALKSNTFDGVLAFFGLGPLPKAWLPRVTVLVGLLGALVAGLIAGQDWQSALAGAVTGAFGGLFAIAGHELVGRPNDGSTANESPVKRGGSSTPPTGLAGGMLVSGLIVVVLGAVMACTGCALFQPGSKFPTDAENAAACVVSDVEKGQTNVAQILLDCKDSETALVLDVVGTLLASPKFAADHPVEHPALKASFAVVRGSR